MKKALLLLLALVTVMGNMPVSAASLASVQVQAQIPQMLELDYWIRSCPSDSTPYGTGSSDAVDMAFGRLNWSDQNKIWLADKYFTVFLVASTSGRPYQIRQDCTGFVSPSTGKTLNNTLLMTPDYKEADRFSANDPASAQGQFGLGDKIGSKNMAVGANKLIFDSPSGVGPKIIRCYYGLATGDPAAQEPAGTEVLTGKVPAGDYSGIVTFSLVLK